MTETEKSGKLNSGANEIASRISDFLKNEGIDIEKVMSGVYTETFHEMVVSLVEDEFEDLIDYKQVSEEQGPVAIPQEICDQCNRPTTEWEEVFNGQVACKVCYEFFNQHECYPNQWRK